MAEEPIRVGLIGAGGNVRNRHIPGFQQVAGCEIVAVANRGIESGQRVADQFHIPRVYAHWQELLADDSINAVCIGTWPYMHRTMTLAALEQGKHVLTEARMASTAHEARDMLAASRRHSDLVCQLTPTSTSYTIDNVLKQMISDGYLGELLSVEMQRLQRDFADVGGDLHWRQDWALSGYNTLNIGASYESVMRWVGRGTRVILGAVHPQLIAARQPGGGAHSHVHLGAIGQVVEDIHVVGNGDGSELPVGGAPVRDVHFGHRHDAGGEGTGREHDDVGGGGNR